jgi:hypothetical protein
VCFGLHLHRCSWVCLSTSFTTTDLTHACTRVVARMPSSFAINQPNGRMTAPGLTLAPSCSPAFTNMLSYSPYIRRCRYTPQRSSSCRTCMDTPYLSSRSSLFFSSSVYRSLSPRLFRKCRKDVAALCPHDSVDGRAFSCLYRNMKLHKVPCCVGKRIGVSTAWLS